MKVGSIYKINTGYQVVDGEFIRTEKSLFGTKYLFLIGVVWEAGDTPSYRLEKVKKKDILYLKSTPNMEEEVK